MPLALECNMPLALETVHSIAHPVSKVHTFADLLWWGCLWLPLYIGGRVLPMLMSSDTENWPQAFCHTGLLKYSTLVVPCWYLGRVIHLWLVHTVILQHRVHDGNIDSHMSASWLLGKCHKFLCCSQQKNQFLNECLNFKLYFFLIAPSSP